MKFISNYFIVFFIVFFLSGCSTNEISKVDNLHEKTSTVPKKSLSQIDLTTIKHIVSQGRVQDNGVADENFKLLSITNDLIENGKDSIPFLISKLDDETKMKRGTIDFWYDVHVGDIALVILTDFFTKSDSKTSTLIGFSWDEFLERGNDKNSTGEAVLRKYISKHGRKKIKKRWQDEWDTLKEVIFWNEKEKCFDVKRSPA